MLDSGAHGNERTRYVVAVGKVMLGNGRSGFLVVHVRMRVSLFELPQRLDAMIGDDNNVGVLVNMLQNCAQYFIEGNVLVGEGLCTHRIDLGVVARVVGCDGIKPVPGPVLTRLSQPCEVGGMVIQKVVKKMSLFIADELDLGQP